MRTARGLPPGGLCGATLLLAALAGSAAAAQQEVRGIVMDGASGTPITGAMVVLLGADDGALGRVLTSAGGAFRLPVQTPARYRVRVDRIGYGSTLTAPFDVGAGEVVQVDVTTTIRPVELPAVEAEGGRRCEVRPAEGVATNRVWEEARKALAAADWAAERQLYRFSWTRYEREVARNGRHVLSERRTPASAYADRPFKAIDAAVLARGGFVLPDQGDRVYYAPDASVLLSDPFLDTHCFALDRKEEDDRPLIGLRFEPVPGRDLADVAGVLWLDEDARLRSLEYRYVNLSPRLGGDDAGGELAFRELPNGTWIVDEWRVRMPNLSADLNSAGDTVRYRVVGFQDEGGAVARVATASGDVVAGGVPGGVLRGTVRDSLAWPVEGVRVRVVGTAYETVTGTDGAFRLPDLGEGTWTVEASHAALAAVGYAGSSLDIALRQGEVRRIELRLPSVRDIVLDRCRATPPGSREAALVGRVVDANGSPAARADVRVLWIRRSTLVGGRTLERDAGVGLATGEDGRYVVCQVPVGDTVRVSATTDELASDTVGVPTDRTIVAVTELVLMESAAAAGAAAHVQAALPAEASRAALLPADSLWLDSKGFWLRSGDALLRQTRRETSTQPLDTSLWQVVSRVPRIEALLLATGERQLRLRPSGALLGGEGCELDVYLNGRLVRQRPLFRRPTPSRAPRGRAQPADKECVGRGAEPGGADFAFRGDRARSVRGICSPGR